MQQTRAYNEQCKQVTTDSESPRPVLWGFFPSCVFPESQILKLGILLVVLSWNCKHVYLNGKLCWKKMISLPSRYLCNHLQPIAFLAPCKLFSTHREEERYVHFLFGQGNYNPVVSSITIISGSQLTVHLRPATCYHLSVELIMQRNEDWVEPRGLWANYCPASKYLHLGKYVYSFLQVTMFFRCNTLHPHSHLKEHSCQGEVLLFCTGSQILSWRQKRFTEAQTGQYASQG